MTEGELLSPVEHLAMSLTRQLAGTLREVIGDGEQAQNDLREAVAHIHALQHAIMSQAAARAYPAKYRLLGEGSAYR
jgi:hypothetical protein